MDQGVAASFWLESLGAPVEPRATLEGVVDADVCIVGAGYTGLWTAWALLRSEPALRVVVVEARHAGFGASGRNGGWLSGLMPGSRASLAATAGRGGVVALQRALIDSVGSVRSTLAAEAIDCDLHVGGTLAVAVTESQLARLRAGLAEDRRWGLGEEDVRMLGPAETAARVRVAGARGSVFSPHCARIQPAKLVQGLAATVERLGGTIYEGTPVQCAEPGWVGSGRAGRAVCGVRAPWVVVATEGYTASLPGRRRRLLPMNSSMIVTAPLPAPAWEVVGWEGAETLSDAAHVYAYLQRTADGRIAIGGRGVPYRYGSAAGREAAGRVTSGRETAGRVAAAGGSAAGGSAGTPAATVAALEATLRGMFPDVPASLLRAERAWSGVLGVARDWNPSIVVSRSGSGSGGVAAAGGYVGDGVTASHLAGRTLADLVLGRDTELTRLPWVGHRARAWEPEPLRWLGVRAVYGMYRAADRSEARDPARARTSGWARVADLVAGRS